MDSENFVRVINQVVSKATKQDMLEDLLDPPGRQPEADAMALSEWFDGLDEQNRIYVEKVIDQAVDATLFGMFSVLDGVRAIEKGEEKGSLELSYTKDSITTKLNDPHAEYLHDIYNRVKGS